MPYAPCEGPEITITVTAAVTPTAIQNWTVTPTSFALNNQASFSGKLVRTDTGAGLGGMSIYLVINGVEAATPVTTASDGSFSGTWKPAAEGIHKLKPRFKGA